MSASVSHHILVNLNLAFDSNSLIFCVLRSFLSQGREGPLPHDSRKLVELKTPSLAFHAVTQTIQDQSFSEEKFNELLRNNFQTLKPIVGAVDTVLHLRGNGHRVTLYTDFPESIVNPSSLLKGHSCKNEQMETLFLMLVLLAGLGDSQIRFVDNLKEQLIGLVEEEDVHSVVLEGDRSVVEKLVEMKGEKKMTCVYMRN